MQHGDQRHHSHNHPTLPQEALCWEESSEISLLVPVEKNTTRPSAALSFVPLYPLEFAVSFPFSWRH